MKIDPLQSVINTVSRCTDTMRQEQAPLCVCWSVTSTLSPSCPASNSYNYLIPALFLQLLRCNDPNKNAYNVGTDKCLNGGGSHLLPNLPHCMFSWVNPSPKPIPFTVPFTDISCNVSPCVLHSFFQPVHNWMLLNHLPCLCLLKADFPTQCHSEPPSSTIPAVQAAPL